MEDRKLDRRCARVRGFYHYYLQRKSVFNGAVVLREVSSALRNDIAVHLYSDYVHRIPFFATQEPSFLALVCGRLVPFYAAAGDTILEVGVIASDLFFILSGKVEALASSAPDAPSFGVLGDGEYFGEGALLALTAAAEAAGGGRRPASPSPTSRGGRDGSRTACSRLRRSKRSVSVICSRSGRRTCRHAAAAAAGTRHHARRLSPPNPTPVPLLPPATRHAHSAHAPATYSSQAVIELYPGIYKELSRVDKLRETQRRAVIWPTNDEGRAAPVAQGGSLRPPSLPARSRCRALWTRSPTIR